MLIRLYNFVLFSAGQKITKRLNDETKPAPPPPVVVLEPPVAEISYHILLTRPRLVQDVGNDLEVIVRYAKSASTLMASHVGLDAEFIELLPDLYDMVTRSVAVWIPCDGRKKQKKGGCIGPAQCRIQVVASVYSRVISFVSVCAAIQNCTHAQTLL